MPKLSLSLDLGENRLGSWFVRYQPPQGGQFPGQLTLTTHRLVFEFELVDATARQIEALVTGPIDDVAVAAAFDLDVPHIHRADRRVCLVLPLGSLEGVVAGHLWFSNWIEVTMKDNGSIQVFERGVRPGTPIVQALRNARQMDQRL